MLKVLVVDLFEELGELRRIFFQELANLGDNGDGDAHGGRDSIRRPSRFAGSDAAPPQASARPAPPSRVGPASEDEFALLSGVDA